MNITLAWRVVASAALTESLGALDCRSKTVLGLDLKTKTHQWSLASCDIAGPAAAEINFDSARSGAPAQNKEAVNLPSTFFKAGGGHLQACASAWLVWRLG